jgi:predicted ATPase/5S rRNA maturation endonuclease (ribonuclease M5)
MFTNLKLLNLPANGESTLLDVGRINIICGKNNSGKSTLLRAIAKKETRSIGEQLASDKINYILTRTSFDLGVRADEKYIRYGEIDKYRKVLLAASHERDLWFSNEAEEFAKEVSEYFEGSFGNRLFDEVSVAHAFGECFVDNMTTVFLPPKRNLEITREILSHTNTKIQPDGGGILNNLFYSRSQPESSEARLFYKKLSDAFFNISSGFHFDVFMGNDANVHLNIAHKDQSWVSADACGLGLQDLIVILFFAILPDHPIILIEEPESHLHPDMQRKLLYFLKSETEKQLFLTTHSNIFLDNALIDRVYFTSFDQTIRVDDATRRASILDDLGYSVADNLVSDLVILVEGPSDVGVIEEFLIKMNLYSKYDIKIWPLGGDIMAQVDLSIFAERYSIIALIDNDPGSKKIREQFKKNCKELKIPVHHLKKYAIENYFTVQALKTVYSHQMPDTVATIVANQKLEKQIGFNVKGQNRSIARAMALDDIKGTDLYGFFSEVKRICTETR